MVYNMVKEQCILVVGICMKENGKIIKSMDMEYIPINFLKLNIKGFTRMVIEVVRVKWYIKIIKLWKLILVMVLCSLYIVFIMMNNKKMEIIMIV